MMQSEKQKSREELIIYLQEKGWPCGKIKELLEHSAGKTIFIVKNKAIVLPAK